MIFAREVSDSLTSLVKKIDAATVKNKSADLRSFVVFCNDDEDLKDKLKELVKKESLKQCVLSIDTPAGPSKYEVAKDADITVVLYTKRDVKVNRAFKKGELDDKAIAAIVDDIAKILPSDEDKKKDDKKPEKKGDK